MTPPAREGGFTLLELLVAITLLGLLMLALFGGLRLGTRAWETSETRVDDAAGLVAVQGFVRSRLQQVHPFGRIRRDGDWTPIFRGEPDRVRFVTRMPLHLGGGLHVVTLTVAENQDGRHLAARWRPHGKGAPRGERGMRGRLLTSGIEAVDFAYFGQADRGGAPGWWETWQEIEDLPELVRVRVRFAAADDRVWPDLIVRPMLDDDLGFLF